MIAIHLLQNNPELKPWPKEPRSPEYLTGYWNIPEERARECVGANIYFHREWRQRSFFGGRIIGYTVHHEEPWAGRIVFALLPDRQCKEVPAPLPPGRHVIKYVE